VASKDRLVEGYARALFAVAQAEGALEDVEDELFRFARTMEAEGRLREALTDPALPPERKKAMLADLLGDRATPHTVNLLGFLVEQGRVRDLSRIVDRLVALAAEQRKRAVAEVRTAVQLTKEQQKRRGAVEGHRPGRGAQGDRGRVGARRGGGPSRGPGLRRHDQGQVGGRTRAPGERVSVWQS
jgi:F-type H+-transporting ATPase subunit delta